MSATWRIDAASFSATMRNLGKVSDEVFAKASKAALSAAGKELQAGVLRNVTLTDHTLKALAALDHPYAKRHGQPTIHTGTPYAVHKQSGRMAGKITGKIVKWPKSWAYRVGFDYGAVPYAEYVVQGTRVMLPRDVIMKTSQEPNVRKSMMLAVVRVMGKELRTGAAIRFG